MDVKAVHGGRIYMIKRYVVAGTFAVMCASALMTAQSGPPPQVPPAPGAPAPAAPLAGAQPTSTTLVGCLYTEDKIPGRTPNAVERAGVLEDYILADASMPSSQSARPGATAGATGTTGSVPSTGNMYKVENLPDERLKPLVGKRVEVMGRIDPEGVGRTPPAGGAPTTDRGPSRDQINLPELEASSIREVAGTCPAAPAARSK
jgi:hypothetical protein